MTLHDPFIISARLLPAVKVGGATISIGFCPKNTGDGRARYDCYIDFDEKPDGGKKEYHDRNLKFGVGGGSIKNGFASFLCFLGAAAESRSYRERTGRQGENEDIFPAWVVEWAQQHSDEISMLQFEIEEGKDLIEE